MLTRLDRIAAFENRSRSDIVRMLLNRALAAHEQRMSSGRVTRSDADAPDIADDPPLDQDKPVQARTRKKSEQ